MGHTDTFTPYNGYFTWTTKAVGKYQRRVQTSTDVSFHNKTSKRLHGLNYFWTAWEPYLSNGRNIRIPLSRRECAREPIIIIVF